MNGYVCLAVFLAGVAAGITLTAWILHRTDKHLDTNVNGQVHQ